MLSFKNTNQLLGRLDGVMGLKTGYTAQAGHCLIAVAEQSGHRVWLVLLDSQRRWSPHTASSSTPSPPRSAATRMRASPVPPRALYTQP